MRSQFTFILNGSVFGIVLSRMTGSRSVTMKYDGGASILAPLTKALKHGFRDTFGLCTGTACILVTFCT